MMLKGLEHLSRGFDRRVSATKSLKAICEIESEVNVTVPSMIELLKTVRSGIS